MMDDNVIGNGPVGFTSDGLDLLRDEMLGRLRLPDDVDVAVEVPAFFVVAADVCSVFLDRNRLRPEDLVELSDRQIAREFTRGELPDGVQEHLTRVAAGLDGPLIVRPSSVLEATLGRFLGEAYRTKVVPNHGDDRKKRTRQLADAIKLVWASTFFADAVNARLAAGQGPAAEGMAVVVQRAVGSRFGDHFYPTITAIARSYNHYPAPGNQPDEGVVSLALGFGMIFSESHHWSYCPKRPTAPPPFKDVNDLLKNTQKSFWALDLGDSAAHDPTREDEHLVRLGLADAESDGTLELLASTYDLESDRLSAGLGGSGARALTFAPMLRSRTIPFTSIVESILESARVATGGEVMVEIAATLDPVHGVPLRIGVVQLKPMPGRSTRDTLKREDLERDGILVASENCLGDGTRTDLEDIVYLKPGTFDRDQTRTMVAELDAVNRGILDEDRSAIFIGFGRWGTTDDRYGVPVRWGQISSARVIVEITLADAPLNLSQGTHFFHHLLSQRVLYLSVEQDGDFVVDFDWLDQVPAVWEGRYVRHVRPERPVRVDVDGGSRRGLIRREPGG